MKRSHCAVGIAATALLLGLTACVSVEADRQPRTGASASVPGFLPEVPPAEESADTSDEYMDLLVNLSWDEQTDADKQAMCDSIEMLGTAWAAGVLEQGGAAYGTRGDEVDWDMAALLIADKCVTEGYS